VSNPVIDFELQIERSYLQTQTCVFWAEQFETIAPVEQAEQTLMKLVGVGKLRCVAELRCCEGHTIWEHDLARLSEGRVCTCDECAEADVHPADAYLRFEIEEDWLGALKKKAQRIGNPR